MTIPTVLPCDGCGQLASAEHIARRLQRLEWSTRFRPIHIHALLFAACAPEFDSDFLYSSEGHFTGQAGHLLSALSLNTEGKSPEEVLTEFQKRGLVHASVLECPVEPASNLAELSELLERHLPQAIVRIRRSLKPKRVLLLSPELQPFLEQFTESAMGCPVFYTPLGASSAGATPNATELNAFRAALPAPAAHSR